MRRSKSLKKAVSVILVMLMMFTVMSSGVSAFAATERIYTIEDTYYTASPDEVVAETELMPLDEYLVEQFSTCPGSVFVNEYKIPTGQINELASLIYDNCPELFHIASLQYYPVNGYIYTLIPTYSCTPEEYAVMLDECEKSADKLLEGIKGNDSLGEVEKALLLHDRIAVLCEYDYENYLNGAIPRESYNMYGTLVNQFAVCQGYAETYLYLLRQVGLDGYICESDELNHAWNIIEVDGEEYHVDITWDDKTWDVTGKVYHDNFLRSSEGIYATGHDATDYITTPVATTYDDYFWQDSQAAFQLLDDEIYYIDYSDAYIRRYSDNSDVKNVSDTWMASASSYYRGCHARLDTDGERLLYTSSKAVFALDAETGDTEEIWRPEGETEYHRIYGFKYEDNYLICDLNKTPNFAADTKTLYQQKKLYPEISDVTSGVCGDNLTWTLDIDGTLTISGTGDMYDFEENGSPWCKNTAIKSVVIPEGVTKIGAAAFVGCTSLTDVYYDGTEAQWNEIAVGENNEPLTSAAMHFNQHTHSYDTVVVTEPTCTAQGYTTYTCACGDSYVADYTDKLQHSYKGVITTPATHTAEGVMTYICDICGDSYTEAIAKTPAHSYSAVVTAPTCIEQGFTTYTCVCGSIYMDNFTDSVPHTDADGDAFCDYCGEDLTVDPSENCSCMCHKDGFMGFIWKIVKFFWSLFGMNPVCECGKAHY